MFKQNKYTTWYYNIMNWVKSQQRQKLPVSDVNYVYYEKHHIVPKSLGGLNNKENLVLLTAREHFIAHLLLPKMCVNKKHTFQMYSALDKMQCSNKHQSRYFNSRIYQLYKRHRIVPKEKIVAQYGQISCKDINTGKFLKVTKEVFYSSDNLVGVNTGRKGQKRSLKFRLSRTGSKNSFYGKHHSKKTKHILSQKISKALLGKPKSALHKQNLKKAWKLRKLKKKTLLQYQ